MRRLRPTVVEQRRRVALGHTPLHAVVDDVSALAMLDMRGKGPVYPNERGRWFIVFVDIGDLSVKVYGVGLLTQQIRMFWSEDLGGDYFARAVSEHLAVGFGAAEELISREDDQAIDGLMPELNELKKFVLMGVVEGRTSDVQAIGTVRSTILFMLFWRLFPMDPRARGGRM